MTKGKGQPQAYGDESYWDNRYSQDAGSFDWYQRYSGLAPLITMYLPKTGSVLMVGCGNAVITEDMVHDGYQEICNIDISQVVIDVMAKKYKDMLQVQYQRMDVRDMKTFKDGIFDSVLDKGMFDSLMDQISWSQWLIECGSIVDENSVELVHRIVLMQCYQRVLKPGGVYMLITYGDPRVRIPHLKTEEFLWDVKLHVIPRPGSRRANEGSSRPVTDPVALGEDMSLGPQFNLEDPDLHYIYVCTKEEKVAPKAPDKVDKKLSKKK